MALDFPSSPSIGTKHPASPAAGQPQYTWDGEKWATTGVNLSTGYVQKAGDTMTGPLVLPADPASALQASTKQYVDNKPGGFAAGTVLPFYMAAAPTGWTKIVTQNDRALRVVSGSGGVAGGVNGFSTVMAQSTVGYHSIDGNELTYHQHYYELPNASGASYTLYGDSGGAGVYGTYTGFAGANWGHTHAITMNMAYIDVILASKD
jgi:hypothetical protein